MISGEIARKFEWGYKKFQRSKTMPRRGVIHCLEVFDGHSHSWGGSGSVLANVVSLFPYCTGFFIECLWLHPSSPNQSQVHVLRGGNNALWGKGSALKNFAPPRKIAACGLQKTRTQAYNASKTMQTKTLLPTQCVLRGCPPSFPTSSLLAKGKTSCKAKRKTADRVWRQNFASSQKPLLMHGTCYWSFIVSKFCFPRRKQIVFENFCPSRLPFRRVAKFLRCWCGVLSPTICHFFRFSFRSRKKTSKRKNYSSLLRQIFSLTQDTDSPGAVQPPRRAPPQEDFGWLFCKSVSLFSSPLQAQSQKYFGPQNFLFFRVKKYGETKIFLHYKKFQRLCLLCVPLPRWRNLLRRIIIIPLSLCVTGAGPGRVPPSSNFTLWKFSFTSQCLGNSAYPLHYPPD